MIHGQTQSMKLKESKKSTAEAKVQKRTECVTNQLLQSSLSNRQGPAPVGSVANLLHRCSGKQPPEGLATKARGKKWDSRLALKWINRSQ